MTVTTVFVQTPKGWYQSCPLLGGLLAGATQVTPLFDKHKPVYAATRTTSHRTFSGKQKRDRLHRRQSGVQTRAAGTQAVTMWRARTPLEALHLLQSQLRLPVQLPPCTLRGSPFGHTLSQLPSLKQGLQVLSGALDILSQPPGGYPVFVLEGVPGWQPRLIRGQRRWLGLRPGRRLVVPDAGPWWTPSGVVHLFQNVPLGVWLAILAWLGFVLVRATRRYLQARSEGKERRRLMSAAKASDLVLQRNRMLRAMGGTVESDVEGEEPASLAAEPHWQDPSEWDAATRRQWDDFMRKSKALRIQRERWWDIDTADDTPHHKTQYDSLKRSGQMQDLT